MKPRLLAAIGIAVVLLVVVLTVSRGCASGAPPAVPMAEPTSEPQTVAPPTATSGPVAATSGPPSPTTVPPTAVPTAPPTPPTTAAPTNTPAPLAAANGQRLGQADLVQIATAMAAAKSYRMTLTSANTTQGAAGTFVIEIVKPDRVHTTTKMGSAAFESISIGQDTYVKIGEKWTKSPGKSPIASALLSSDPQKIIDNTATAQKGGTFTKGAATQVDGIPCQEWTWTPNAATVATAAAEVGGTPTAAAAVAVGTICVGLKDNLPVQFKTADGKIVAKYSDWNAPISIEAPI